MKSQMTNCGAPQKKLWCTTKKIVVHLCIRSEALFENIRNLSTVPFYYYRSRKLRGRYVTGQEERFTYVGIFIELLHSVYFTYVV